jgi:hypothetical protein
VYGVRHEGARNWNRPVTVRGYIVHVYVPMVQEGNRPPRVCRPNECNEERPHVYIADTANEQDPEKRMMVTGYATFQAEIDDARRAAASGRTATAQNTGGLPTPGRTIPTDFNQGAQITVTGTFTRRASNGQADSNGLVEYQRHTTNQPAPAQAAAAPHH